MRHGVRVFILSGIFEAALLAGTAWREQGLASSDPYPLRVYYQGSEGQLPDPAAWLSNSVNDRLLEAYDREMEEVFDGGLATTQVNSGSNGGQLPYLPSEKQAIEIAKEFARRNRRVLARLSAGLGSRRGHKPQEPAQVGQVVFAKLRSHLVARDSSEIRYDPDRDVGFCFGRALFVHLELRKRGIPENRIAKIFAVGDFQYGASIWKFHVATMFRDEKGVWWVIDSLQSQVLEVSEWTKRVYKIALNPKYPQVRFYTTEAMKFKPDSGEYSKEDLTVPEYRGYFSQLVELI